MFARIRKLFTRKPLDSSASPQQSEAAEVAEPSAPEDALANARESVSRDLRSGFVSADQAIEKALEVFEEVPPEQLQPVLREWVAAELARMRSKRDQWTAPTDCDRLAEAFAALEKAGILARENFTCCQTCGNAAISEEIEEARKAGREVRGYTYFHEQDTERAVEGGLLLLAFGAAGSEAPETIGGEVAGVLSRAGLKVNWSGQISKRIGVELEWRRRDNVALDS